MRFDLIPPRDQLVAIMSRIYNNGMTTLSGGNLSIKDADGDIWITPSAIDKGGLKPDDIMQVCQDGTMKGLHTPSSELPFHRAIYARRPDLNAIVHAHAPALVAFSIARKVPNTRIIPQARLVCGDVGYSLYAQPGSERLGTNLAEAFGEGYDVVLLENHGAATGGTSLLDAFHRLETLDFCARTQMHAQAMGEVTSLTDAQIARFDTRDNILPEFTHDTFSSRERELRQKIVDMVHRACDRQLMISTEGVVSARVDPDNFLITPTRMDRRSITQEDVVLVRNGKREAGKLPSRSVHLHIAIYDQQPEIHSIVTAQSPYAASYAVSTCPFDTKTIPESYVMLRDVPKVTYDLQPIASILAPNRPVLLIENYGVLTTGASILQALDRLEVVEFTAKSLIEIETMAVGDLVPIGEAEIRELERVYFGAET